MQTPAALLLLCIPLTAIVVIRHRSGKKKYEHADYLQHLETIKAFIEEVKILFWRYIQIVFQVLSAWLIVPIREQKYYYNEYKRYGTCNLN